MDSDKDEHRDVIATIPFFEEFTPTNLKRLRNIFTTRTFDAGEVVDDAKQKEASFFHVVVTGSIKISTFDENSADKKETVLRIINKGGWYNEEILVDGVSVPARITSCERTLLLSVSYSNYCAFREEDSSLELSISPRRKSTGEQRRVTLSSIPFFKAVPPLQVQQLVSLLQFKWFKLDETVCEEGTSADGFYIILSGSVEITSGGQFLETLKENDFFGEMALVENVNRIATVRAIQDSSMLFMERKNFHNLKQILPEVFGTELFRKTVRQRTANSLKAIPLFAALILKEKGPVQKFDHDKLETLAGMFKYIHADEGKDVITCGQRNSYFYIVVHGKLHVYSEYNNLIDTLSEGMWFGEMSLGDKNLSSATVRAVDPCILLRLHSKNYEQFRKVHDDISAEIDTLMAARRLNMIKTWPFFRRVDSTKLKLLESLLKFEEFKEESTVFEQGQEGDKFYLLVRGHVKILVLSGDTQITVDWLQAPNYFGEIAMLQPTARTATVRCVTRCVFYTLTSENFEKVLDISPDLRSAVTEITQWRTANALSNIDLFKDIQGVNKLECIGALLEYQTAEKGEVIFNQGDVGDKFYIIGQGEAESTIKGGTHLNDLARGDFFGEMTLMIDEQKTRNATVTAKTDCVFLTMTTAHFRSLLQLCPEIKEPVENVIRGRQENLFWRTQTD